MANQFDALPAPAANGSGAGVDVSSYGALKTIVVEGNGSLLYEPYVQIEMSNDTGPTNWTPIYRFLKPGSVTIPVACRYLRATVQNYVRGGAPVVNVGGTDDGTTFATLVAPAGNGVGASVDVSALPGYKTVQCVGTFKGTAVIQVSNDAGTTWSQADGFAFNSKGGQSSDTLIGQFMRIKRSGIPLHATNVGTPVFNVGASTLSAGGSGVVAGTLLAVQTFVATGTYTPTVGATQCRLRGVASGGAGGGVEGTSAVQIGVGGGGAAGAYIDLWIDPGVQLTGGAVTIGAAGVPGAAGNTPGGTAADANITIQGVLYTLKGGGGGAGSPAQGAGTGGVSAGGTVANGSFAASTLIYGLGENGLAAFGGSGAALRGGGAGGSTPLGGGGRRVSNAAGAAGVGKGGGGSGADGSNLAALAGGAGVLGTFVVEEYS